MDYLKEGKKMQKYDWLVLFPGLLLLDVEIIKHLPWGADLKVDGKKMVDNDGMPHKYFTWVAYIAVMLEDLPQVVLQVAFVVVIEEDDGWAITAAMASLTLSMADVLVKLVFPPFIKRLTKHSRSCLRRVNAMDRTGLCGQLCPQHSMAERGETSEDVEHPENQ
ncbi:unnamed protein product [Ostreobium quekettii]|uniref:Uncharacterized protein n=1 Tax=Ostreobium quekettii TaxID=121088 RepID=A0A8S1IVM4_9CHLO|nr:unnamed protein product [Ostreobium quekettii]